MLSELHCSKLPPCLTPLLSPLQPPAPQWVCFVLIPPSSVHKMWHLLVLQSLSPVFKLNWRCGLALPDSWSHSLHVLHQILTQKDYGPSVLNMVFYGQETNTSPGVGCVHTSTPAMRHFPLTPTTLSALEGFEKSNFHCFTHHNQLTLTLCFPGLFI